MFLFQKGFFVATNTLFIYMRAWKNREQNLHAVSLIWVAGIRRETAVPFRSCGCL